MIELGGKMIGEIISKALKKLKRLKDEILKKPSKTHLFATSSYSGKKIMKKSVTFFQFSTIKK